MKTNNNITKSKYIRFIFILIGFFVLFSLLGAVCGVLYDILLITLSLVAAFGVFILLLPLCYFLMKLIKLEKNVALLDKKIGKIENWQRGFIRGFGNVSLKIDGIEYYSDSVYTCDEARDLVGKSVRYCIIGDNLIILDLIKLVNNELSD